MFTEVYDTRNIICALSLSLSLPTVLCVVFYSVIYFVSRPICCCGPIVASGNSLVTITTSTSISPSQVYPAKSGSL